MITIIVIMITIMLTIITIMMILIVIINIPTYFVICFSFSRRRFAGLLEFEGVGLCFEAAPL